MNEDINRPGTDYVSGQPIQRLVNDATGLRLTTPVNPFNNDDRTISIQSRLTARFDYILPCAILQYRRQPGGLWPATTSAQSASPEVAFLLDFEDANSFFRAFQGWERTSPGEWRTRGKKE
jgi:hypothetical protein